MEAYRVEIKQTFEIIAKNELEAVSIGDDYIKNNVLRGKGEMIDAEVSLCPVHRKNLSTNIRNLADYR